MAGTPRRQRKPRNYKAEYARRIAKGRAAGKSRQESRGHARAEHVERKARVLRRYGVTPRELTRANKIRNHFQRLLPSGKFQGVSIFASINAAGEPFFMGYSAADLRATARLKGSEFAEEFADFLDEDFDSDLNPAWYHGGSGGGGYEGGV